MLAPVTLDDAVSAFGLALKAKLSNPAVSGQPEDQLRGPLDGLVKGLARLAGLPDEATQLVGETSLADIATRPDFAVTVHKALVGFIEVKAPGKGADPRRFTDAHDKAQWAKLKSLPNLIYTDGAAFSLWRDGKLHAGPITLDGDIATAGAKLKAPPALVRLFDDFLRWNPVAPRTVRQLAETAARLCRLLRDEVTEELARGNRGLTDLATEWRGLLFPEASDAEFADGYAQAVTFGLLMARARGIALSGGIERAAAELRSSNSLIATALRLLTDDDAVRTALKSALQTLARVLDAVNWTTLTRGDVDAWLYFYEDFLAVYDNTLRKRTGSYYTPPEVVAAMVRLVDEALKDPELFGVPQGLASPDVTVADPAVGTGAYLLGALRRIADTVAADRGPGAVPAAITEAARRLIGFEMQFGPFAVAQLRLLAEFQTLTGTSLAPDLRLFITDTLGDPYAQMVQFSAMTRPISESRRQANAIKRGEPITVVIGNPPYKEKAKGRGGWVEAGTPGRKALMAQWTPPKAWGAGAHAKHLKNLYVYFWRWATWKVFGSGHDLATEEVETDRAGVICFITVAGFLNGPGFQKMRADLRAECSHIWVIDCSPEGHQPEVATRVFQGVQQPVCIVLALRPKAKDPNVPATLHFRALPEGPRRAKFAALEGVSLRGAGWTDGPRGGRQPFLPKREGLWGRMTAIDSLFDFNGSGLLAGRTWVIAPDVESLRVRWSRLLSEKSHDEKQKLFHPTLRSGKLADRHIDKVVRESISGQPIRDTKISKEVGEISAPVRFPYRSFDLQYIVPDNRLILSCRDELWKMISSKQIFITALTATSPKKGAAVTFTGLVPDQDHYNGRGGRVFPLWRDAEASVSNIRQDILDQLARAYGAPAAPQDVMAYIAAVLAHPAYTATFKADLKRPGLRVPLTADAALFAQAAALGREVIWLHCYGERCADPAAGRPAGPPPMAAGTGPVIPAGGGVPGAPAPLPDVMRYDPAARRLHIGDGVIDQVPQAVWDYEVSGKNVLRQWFSYRRLNRAKPPMGDKRPPSPLQAIQPDHWPDSYTVDLMNLLHVLGRLVLLEPAQAALLERICDGELIPAGADADD